MSEAKIAGQTYRAGRLAAFDAMDVAKRLSGALIALSATEKEDFSGEDFAKGFILMAAGITRTDVDAAVGMLLGVCHRKISGDTGWAPVMVDGNLMFPDDMDFTTMLQVAHLALVANRLIGKTSFFAMPPQTSGGGKTAE